MNKSLGKDITYLRNFRCKDTNLLRELRYFKGFLLLLHQKERKFYGK